jgi:hypothetical protein
MHGVALISVLSGIHRPTTLSSHFKPESMQVLIQADYSKSKNEQTAVFTQTSCLPNFCCNVYPFVCRDTVEVLYVGSH